MATAKTVGVKLGSLAGKGAGGLWNVTCRVAAATGDLGEGFMEGAESGWEVSMANEELRKAQAKAKLVALLAERMQQQALNAPVVIAPAPVGKTAKAA